MKEAATKKIQPNQGAVDVEEGGKIISNHLVKCRNGGSDQIQTVLIAHRPTSEEKDVPPQCRLLMQMTLVINRQTEEQGHRFGMPDRTRASICRVFTIEAHLKHQRNFLGELNDESSRLNDERFLLTLEYHTYQRSQEGSY